MGAAILIAALVIEAVFAAYCIVTRSSQKKVWSLISIGAFAAFVILALASAIEWSFRWYGLAALLFVWAALGAWTLARKTEERSVRGTGRIVLGATATLALVAIALTPVLVFPQHRPPKMTGEHKVATVSYTYTDEDRTETFTNTGEKRKVNVELWYPGDADGTYPLVVFSHGAFGMKASNTSTFTELASHGYVVCSIDHPYHSLFTRGADGKLITVDPSFRQEIYDVNQSRYDDETELRLTQKWMKVRTADIDFVLDTIVERARDAGSDDVYRRVDPAKIGLIGHSLGGAAGVQVGRERDDIGAVVNLDGDLLGEYLGIADGKPVLNDGSIPSRCFPSTPTT